MTNSVIDQRVVVVIVNYNGGAMLRNSLLSLNRQSVLPGKIIVVDNDSKDGSADELPKMATNIELIRSKKNLGFAAGNNLAIENLKCEWVVLLNPDCYPEPNWLQVLLDAAERNPSVSAFGSKLLMANDAGVLDGIGDAYHISGFFWRSGHRRLESDYPDKSLEIFSPCAAAAMYRRSSMVEAGVFDDRFFCYGEDVDLGFRMRLLGHSALYVPEARVFHESSGVTGYRSDFSVYHGHRNLVWVYLKNMPLAVLFLTLPFHVIASLLLGLVVWRRGQLAIYVKAKLDALSGIGWVISQRKIVQKNRKVPLIGLLRVMSFRWRRL